MKVTPHSVSGRVVKIGIGSPASVLKTTSAPSLRPIQLVCIVLHALGPVDLREVEQLVGVVGDAEEPLLQVAS